MLQLQLSHTKQAVIFRIEFKIPLLTYKALTGHSHQKRLEQPWRPAAIHFQCTLATMNERSDRRCERLEQRVVSVVSVES